MKQLFVNAANRLSAIDRNIFGHFSEHLGRGIYGGVYVGEDSAIPNLRGIRSDVAEALRHIRVPALRWPGGCFADFYNWRDGIGPKSERRHIVNTSWGGAAEDNSFGTHEFLDFCGQVGCAPYIAGNVGSGTVREMREWVEYMNAGGESPMAALRRGNGREEPWGVEYIGIGNENWGGGGHMSAEYYAGLYKQFATFIHPYGGTQPFKVACGPNGADYAWTDTLMRLAGPYMDGLSLHYYTMPGSYPTDMYKWEEKGPATGFDEANYYRSLRRALFMDELIRGHSFVMDRYDPEKRVAIMVDEWGAWHTAEAGTNPAFLYQQNTMRDAIVAAVSLNIFMRHGARVKMANLAQMVNVLQSLILTDGERMLLTPTYHVFDLYKAHQDAALLECYVQGDSTGTEEARVPALDACASLGADGRVRVTLANLCANEAQSVRCTISGGVFSRAELRYISGEITDFNTFEESDKIVIREAAAVPVKDGGFGVEAPACSVLEVTLA